MKKSKSSKKWLQEHFSDKYVKKAQQEGHRGRAIYKLIEIQQRYKIVKSGMFVVDLGAAPGSWSEYLAGLVQPAGRVIAVDILPMQPVPGVQFMQGDFSESEFVEQLLKACDGGCVDVVVSDMAPNTSGIIAVDQLRVLNLVATAFVFAQRVLKFNGVFVTKVFQGAGFDEFLQSVKKRFKSVQIIKPDASRSRSRELFLLAKGFKGLL